MRYTHKNPDGKTYRIWMDQAGDFNLKSQGGELFASGDMVNKLGRLEDQEEKKEKRPYRQI